MQHLLQQEAVCRMKRLSGRMWASFILIGFVGQLAWTIENMYFNVFLYNTISTDPNALPRWWQQALLQRRSQRF